MKKALVSLAVGDRCFGPWSRYLHANWSAWCRKHGYDLIVFDTLLDTSPFAQKRSPAWQKLLAMASPILHDFDRAFWLDADVLICPEAADPTLLAVPSLVSMARDVGSPLAHEPLWFKHQWSRVLFNSLQRNHGNSFNPPSPSTIDHFSYLQLWGFNQFSRPLYNTGMIVFTPKLHSSLFSDIYHRWLDGGPGALYEMIPLNLELYQKGLIDEISTSFNQLAGVQHAVWSYYPFQVQAMHKIPSRSRLTTNDFLRHLAFSSSFLHFAGAQQLMVDFLNYCESDFTLRASMNLAQEVES